jgi:hypothetical protein
MPHYFFHLKGDRGTIPDPNGTELLDQRAARAHGCQVARELMRHREFSTRMWRLDVCDDKGNFCFDLLFASVDDSIAHLGPDLRSSLEAVCRNTASLSDAIGQVEATLLQLRSTLRDGPLSLASTTGAHQGGE